MIEVWHLRNVHWLRDLPREESERLRRAATTRDHERGETIFAPTPTPESIFLLERGLVRIYRISESGAETTFGYVLPGEVFGELGVFTQGGRESFAQAVRRSTVWRIPAEIFRAVASASPGMTVEITKQIAGRMRRIESRVEDLVFRDVRTRLARVLGELAESFGRPEAGEGVEIALPLTQSDLATLVGSTRQTVNVALGTLEHEGLLVQRHRHIVLTKPARLRAVASSAAG